MRPARGLGDLLGSSYMRLGHEPTWVLFSTSTTLLRIGAYCNRSRMAISVEAPRNQKTE
jgi:hypothetical protein